MDGSICELAKNLILSGVNIILVDNQTITEDDCAQNFLYYESTIGQNKGETVKKALSDMNPLVSIELFQNFDSL